MSNPTDVEVERIAIMLLAYEEDGEFESEWAANYVRSNKTAPHDGDCEKAEHQGPWTCSRCQCDRLAINARTLLAALPSRAEIERAEAAASALEAAERRIKELTAKFCGSRCEHEGCHYTAMTEACGETDLIAEILGTDDDLPGAVKALKGERDASAAEAVARTRELEECALENGALRELMSEIAQLAVIGGRKFGRIHALTNQTRSLPASAAAQRVRAMREAAQAVVDDVTIGVQAFMHGKPQWDDGWEKIKRLEQALAALGDHPEAGKDAT